MKKPFNWSSEKNEIWWRRKRVARGFWKEWNSIYKNKWWEKKYFSEIAKNTVEQKKMINFRVNERDFRNLKMKASELGIPYQTLLKILIHQFTEGKVKLNL